MKVSTVHWSTASHSFFKLLRLNEFCNIEHIEGEMAALQRRMLLSVKNTFKGLFTMLIELHINYSVSWKAQIKYLWNLLHSKDKQTKMESSAVWYWQWWNTSVLRGGLKIVIVLHKKSHQWKKKWAFAAASASSLLRKITFSFKHDMYGDDSICITSNQPELDKTARVWQDGASSSCAGFYYFFKAKFISNSKHFGVRKTAHDQMNKWNGLGIKLSIS